ncbi:MAG TPA: amino acid ABC transporter ATP-binding protein, partial [Actinomycetes bacterium]|nr:amino acid ABC transporter ATP-binding protein [Actinomycetes bacterium]
MTSEPGELGKDTTPPTGEPLVVLEKVNKYFGDLHVLQDIDLTVHRGE